jgi:putative membrane protein
MNLLHKKSWVKKLPQLMGIMGVSSAIAITGYVPTYQQAIAHTTPINSLSRETTISQASLSEIDRIYVEEIAQAGMLELEMAQLALEKSDNENIKKYAQQMIQDHQALNQELMQLAENKGITLPTTLSPKHQALKTQVSKLSGTQFDQAYINEAAINAHIQSLILHTRQIQLGEDQDLQAYAIKTIPIVDTHLQLAEMLFMRPMQL